VLAVPAVPCKRFSGKLTCAGRDPDYLARVWAGVQVG